MIRELDNTAKSVLCDEIKDAIGPQRYSFLYRTTKRLFDIVCSLFGLLFLLPITIVVKIAYMVTGDFHSIFYTQDRIGLNGKIFKLYKFRSMVPNADEILKDILKYDKKRAREYRLNKKMTDDPRITKAGKWIRKHSVDELPQLINIFIGDMSLIGNRPYLPREKKDMGKYYDDIVKTKPGLTGFWQCSLRSRGTFEDRLKMEQYYSNNFGIRFDMSIFFKTFSVVIGGHGAK